MDGIVDSDLDQTFEIVERDTVPAPPSQQSDSYKERLSTLLKWLQPTDFLSPGSEFMKHLHSYVTGTGDWIHKSPVFTPGSAPTPIPTLAVVMISMAAHVSTFED